MLRFFSVLALLLIAVGLAPDADAWVGGAVVVGAPAYYYPAPYPYPAPYSYPPPMPPVAMAPVPGGPVYGNNAPPQEDCREYTHEVTIAGERQTAHGHACRQQDGTWQITD